MATVKFNVAIDMATFAGYSYSTIFGTGGGASQTGGTRDDIHYNTGYYEVVLGTGFSGFGPAEFPGAGTVTDWELGIRDTVLDPTDPFNSTMVNESFWNFSGLSVPAVDLGNAVGGDGGTLAAYMPTMLAGNDIVRGSDYNDHLLGYNGNDTVVGNAGNDTLEGGSGNDILNGGTGQDVMMGSFGSDTYIVDNALDQVIEDGSDGIDTVKSSINYTLGDNVDRLVLTGSAALNGVGNDLNNVITGNNGANSLRGVGGNDTLRGGGGNDTLAGGIGNDVLTGGAGADHFLFASTLDSSTNHDRILDFSVAADTIDLDNDVFTAAGAVGTLAAGAFFAGTAAHDAGDRIIYNSATGNIYYDADGDGAGAQIFFAHVTAGTALTNSDFLIVG